MSELTATDVIETAPQSQAWARDKRFTPKAWLASFAVAVCLIVAICAWITRSYVAHAPLVADEPARMTECRSRTLNALGPHVVDLNLLGNVHGLCYAEINEEDTLLEFGIRRSAFINQQVEIPVMLWMVVAITLSGVLLAGLQLVAAYKLALVGRAAFEQGGTLSVESKKISLNSSVTGILILIISLAFFYVFVTQVYLIKEVGDAPGTSVAGTPDFRLRWGKNPPALDMKAGGLGSAPSGSPAESSVSAQKTAPKGVTASTKKLNQNPK